MKTSSVIVWLSLIALVAFAILWKAEVRAGGKFKGGEFFIEAK